MSPPFIFRIDEVAESQDSVHHVDWDGYWTPTTERGESVRVAGGASDTFYYCNRQQIYPLPGGQLPPGSTLYKVFSIYYISGRGFRVLRGNATNPPQHESWQPLYFDWEDDYSSFVTNAGTRSTLRIQRPDQNWPRMLLPDIYHASATTGNTSYGGLIGELPIFLALIALSVVREYVPHVLQTLFQGGSWGEHGLAHGRSNQRGVVVSVWTCPQTYSGGSTVEDLRSYEEGTYGKYYP